MRVRFFMQPTSRRRAPRRRRRSTDPRVVDELTVIVDHLQRPGAEPIRPA